MCLENSLEGEKEQGWLELRRALPEGGAEFPEGEGDELGMGQVCGDLTGF